MTRGTLLVTGAASHTGRRAVRRMLAEGRHLKLITRDAEALRRILRPEDDPRADDNPSQADYETLVADLSDASCVAKLADFARGCDAVVHIAHIGFAETVIRICRESDVRRLICISSTRRFTSFPDATAQRVIDGEKRVTDSDASDLNTTILRPSMIYGDEGDNNLARVARWLKRSRWMPLVRGGRNLVQPIFVDDLIQAILRAVDRPEATRGRALTLAGPEAITWRAMIAAVGIAIDRPVRWIPLPYSLVLAAAGIAQILPGRSIVTTAQIRRLLEDKAFDIDEATEALGGWRPRAFDEGIGMKRAQNT